jgi:hypothetical protein
VTWKDIDGKSIERSIEGYYGGRAGRNLNLELLEPLYTFTAPPKKPVFIKPEKIELSEAGEKPKILFIRGLWAEFQGVDEALAKLGDVEVVNGWMKKTALGETVGNFPGSYEDLMSYDVIILGNVSGPMLGALGQEMLADFARAGGGILLLSGDRTYGQAHFTNHRFTDLLPASFEQGGDYGKLPSPSALTVTPGLALTAGMRLPRQKDVSYAHRVPPKENSVTVVYFDNGEPALLLSPPGTPKVALITALPFGTDDSKNPLYFHQEEWQELLARVINGLMPTREETK